MISKGKSQFLSQPTCTTTRRLFWAFHLDYLTYWDVHTQHLWDWNFYFLFSWVPRVGICQYLDFYPHLSCVHHCYPGKLYHPIFHKNGTFFAWAHVLFPLHVGSLWPRTFLLFSPYHAKDFLVQCSRNFSWCLLCPRVFHPWILSYGVICASHYVFWSLHCNLQPSEIYHHSYQCQSHPNWTCLFSQKFFVDSSFSYHFKTSKIL